MLKNLVHSRVGNIKLHLASIGHLQNIKSSNEFCLDGKYNKISNLKALYILTRACHLEVIKNLDLEQIEQSRVTLRLKTYGSVFCKTQ